MDITRMLKSVAWTVNCPMYAFAVQAGPGTSPLPLEMAYSATPPETVLFKELIRSVVESCQPRTKRLAGLIFEIFSYLPESSRLQTI